MKSPSPLHSTPHHNNGVAPLEHPHPRIGVVRIDRGDNKNPLSLNLLHSLRQSFLSIRDDHNLSALILTGTPDVFSVGADLKDPNHQKREHETLLQRRQSLRIGPDVCNAVAELQPITIAAVEGHCIGGALAIAASCDVRVASSSARFRLPEVALAMNMSWGALPRLVNLIGPAKTKLLAALGVEINAETAAQWGLVDYVVEPRCALQKALLIAQQAANLPPVAVRMIKQGVDAATLQNSNAAALDLDQYALAASSNDYKEAVRAFRDKRKPSFSGDLN